MNIAEILKDCPKGTKFYSLLFGVVRLYGIKLNDPYPIVVSYNCSDGSKNMEAFTKDGKMYDAYDGGCVLFPSKENRDWSTFKVPKTEYEFKAFDRVLVRNDDRFNWACDFFSHKINGTLFCYICTNGAYKQCIPFEGNEHLVGTSNPA